MRDHLFIYLIVLLNALCQVMLIKRLKMPGSAKLKFSSLALVIPVSVALAMRLAVHAEMMPVHVAEQTGFERMITTVTSIMLLAGPWMVTVAAICFQRKSEALKRAEMREAGPKECGVES